MEFPALDLRKASVLKKQVDLALLKLKQAVLDGDAEKKSELVQAFQIQIDAIEEFRTANDNDERSILFERERIRLRKGVQDAAAPAHGASNSAKSKGTHSLGKVPARVAVKGAHIHAESAKEVSADTPMVHSSPTKQIYSWENPEDGLKERTPIHIEGSVFAPMEEPGLYANDFAMGETKSQSGGSGSTKFVDMYFVLNAEEVSILASRLNHRKTSDKKNFRNAGSAATVQNTPFIDASRIQKSLYRQDKPDKWMDKTCMRPNAK